MGLLWMTATMRRNYELFGSFICVGMMKRGITTLLWTYTVITMLDEMNRVCVACEEIICRERHHMFFAQAIFLNEYAPRRLLTEVFIIAGDGVF